MIKPTKSEKRISSINEIKKLIARNHLRVVRMNTPIYRTETNVSSGDDITGTSDGLTMIPRHASNQQRYQHMKGINDPIFKPMGTSGDPAGNGANCASTIDLTNQ